MRELWHDINTHRASASVFLFCWLGVFTYTFLTWTRGIPPLAMALHLVMPVLSGALVAWWRFPRCEGLLASGWRPAGPPLSGILIAVVAVSVVFLREAIVAVESGSGSVTHAVDFLLSCVVATSIFAAIASVFAPFVAFASQLIARAFRPKTPKRTEAA